MRAFYVHEKKSTRGIHPFDKQIRNQQFRICLSNPGYDLNRLLDIGIKNRNLHDIFYKIND